MSDFQIEDYTPVTAANPYTAHVEALLAAGEGKQLGITVPQGTKQDGTPGDGAKDKLAFQQAANAADRTARVVSETDNGDGTVTIKFILTAKNKRAGRPKGASAEVEAVEVETEV